MMALGLKPRFAPNALIPMLKGREEQDRGWQEGPGRRRAEGIQVEVTAGTEEKRSSLPAEEWQEMCLERKYQPKCATPSGSLCLVTEGYMGVECNLLHAFVPHLGE